MKGLDSDLNQQIKDNKRHGGPSDEFKKEALKHGVKLKYSGVRERRRDGYCFMGIDEKTWKRIFGKV